MLIFRKNAEAVAVAISQIYTHDVMGPESNPSILRYAAEAGFPDYKNDDTSWCALFMNWVMRQINIPGTGSLAARSFLDFGLPVISERTVGDIAVFWRVSPASWQGHVGLYLNSVERDGKEWLRILGGNQGDQVKVSEFPATQLLTYRRIKEL